MAKLGNIINGMNYKELTAIEKDLYEGNIARLIKHRKSGFEKLFSEKICPTCGSSIKENEAPFTLLFGPVDFKKKASFCGLDCLSFFIKKLEKQNNDMVKH